MTDERKFCRDCKHVRMTTVYGAAQTTESFVCGHDINRDIVSKKIEPIACHTMRFDLKSCGLTGDLWERWE